MTEAVFQAPKRRAKIYESFEAPLPVSFSRENGDIIIYRAEIISHHVIVTDPAHIQALYERGYFGKGVFSRSRPEHMISQQWKYIGDRCLPVISSSEYQKRIGWAQAALLMQGLEEDAVSNALQTLTKRVELDIGDEHGREPIKCQIENFGGSLVDQLVDDMSGDADLDNVKYNLGHTDAEKPQCQGNPLYDPLAELYPEEPEQLDQHSNPSVKCKRHDDWIIHCGCWPDERQSMSSKLSMPDVDPSEGYEYVLVEELEDGDNKNTEENSEGRSGKLVCRINPFTMMEYLQLSYEEAFFLVYALGCLSVYYSGEPLSVIQLWAMFCSVQPNFSTTYTAYHYFRSKGWVPKSGIKYGTDLMLYRKGPPFYHASYSVVVDRVDDSCKAAALRPFSWRSFATLSRITGNVSKSLGQFQNLVSCLTVSCLHRQQCSFLHCFSVIVLDFCLLNVVNISSYYIH
ncbi:tRNA-splicing endonuclease subunit Sen2 isoform X2 [Myxocyprinus asiaticus]|uniref:tRNA-splicing endonuclease subunit Sen2 isoform X2 n=1 Tax=Myxocyprinus asiaticus TaxID=70543 RepID=UPI002221AED5|nr:tRNA-splicing endonuclease subunit Sen2 isoform X2 [Myxocyprinus asiaticus]